MNRVRRLSGDQAVLLILAIRFPGFFFKFMRRRHKRPDPRAAEIEPSCSIALLRRVSAASGFTGGSVKAICDARMRNAIYQRRQQEITSDHATYRWMEPFFAVSRSPVKPWFVDVRRGASRWGVGWGDSSQPCATADRCSCADRERASDLWPTILRRVCFPPRTAAR